MPIQETNISIDKSPSKVDLEYRVSLWKRLVKALTIAPCLSVECGNQQLNQQMRQEAKKYDEDNPSLWSLIFSSLFTTFWLVMWFGIIILSLTLMWLYLIDVYSLSNFSFGLFTFCISCLFFCITPSIIRSLKLSIRKWKYHKLPNKLAQLKFITSPMTLEDREIKVGSKLRKVAYWQEKDLRVGESFKWFNAFEKNDHAISLLFDCLPELRELVENRVDTYPINVSQFEFLINNYDGYQLSDPIAHQALCDFMEHDNHLSTKDLIVLNDALDLHQQLTNAKVPQEHIKETVKSLLGNHFLASNNEIKNNKNPLSFNTHLEYLRKTLTRLHTFPDALFEQMKKLAVFNDVEMIKQKHQTIQEIVNQTKEMLIANPHIQCEYQCQRSWNDTQFTNNTDLVNALIQYLQEHQQAIINQIIDNVKSQSL